MSNRGKGVGVTMPYIAAEARVVGARPQTSPSRSGRTKSSVCPGLGVELPGLAEQLAPDWTLSEMPSGGAGMSLLPSERRLLGASVLEVMYSSVKCSTPLTDERGTPVALSKP